MKRAFTTFSKGLIFLFIIALCPVRLIFSVISVAWDETDSIMADLIGDE